jgi:hypothetical protein
LERGDASIRGASDVRSSFDQIGTKAKHDFDQPGIGLPLAKVRNAPLIFVTDEGDERLLARRLEGVLFFSPVNL